MTPSRRGSEAAPGHRPGGWDRPLPRDFYGTGSLELAPRLLNKLLITADGRAGRIIEVEAYRGREDPASHAFRGRTRRNGAMFGPPGHLYVYFSYGVHWCANVVARAEEGDAQAVLLRALDPVGRLDLMRTARWRNQRHQDDRDLCRGPGRLCQALGIGRAADGTDLVGPGPALWIADDGTPPPAEPVTAPRVGISVATEPAWRFLVGGHPGVSRPVPGTGSGTPARKSSKSTPAAPDPGSVVSRPRTGSTR